MKVQLLYFPGCPNIELARRLIRSTLRDFPNARVEEIDVQAAHTPASLKAWGSPTILVDGKDIAGQPAAGTCCRLYEDHHPESRGVPSEALFRAALGKA